jgi:hypothetical protein
MLRVRYLRENLEVFPCSFIHLLHMAAYNQHPEKQSTDIAVQIRREWVASQYLKGLPKPTIWQEYQKEYGLSYHSFEKDITHARNGVTVDVFERYQEVVNEEFQWLFDQRGEAMKEDNRSEALRIQKLVIDMLKAIAPKNPAAGSVNIQVNNNGNTVQLPDLSIDQIRNLLHGTGSNTDNTNQNNILDITPQGE